MIPWIDRDVVKADDPKLIVLRAKRLPVTLCRSRSGQLQSRGSVLAGHVHLNQLQIH